MSQSRRLGVTHQHEGAHPAPYEDGQGPRGSWHQVTTPTKYFLHAGHLAHLIPHEPQIIHFTLKEAEVSWLRTAVEA